MACTNPVPRDDGSRGTRGACGFPLAELLVRPAPVEVLEVQDLYLRAAEGQALRLAGKEVSPAGWFAEMRALVALARLAGPREFPGLCALPGLCAQAWRDDHVAEEASRSWLWKSHPPSPVLTAGLLQALSPVLLASGEPEFRDAASWLFSSAYRRREARHFRAFDPKFLPPLTRRAFMTSQHRGTSRVFLGKFLHPEPQLARLGLAVAHIPWHADRDDVLEQVTPHLAPGQEAEPGGWPQRRFAAFCLAIMVSGARTWDEAAAELEMPPVAGGRRKPPGGLTVTDLMAFREGLIILGSRLAERGLIDYRARRAALADLAEMPAGDWAGRPSATGQLYRERRPGRSRVFAAAWIWSDLTGGRYDESPAWAALNDSDAPVVTSMGSRRDYSRFYGSWQHGQGPARRDWLRSWGARYLEERSCQGAPR